MEKMPFNEATMAATITMAMNHSIVSTEWQKGLPVFLAAP